MLHLERSIRVDTLHAHHGSEIGDLFWDLLNNQGADYYIHLPQSEPGRKPTLEKVVETLSTIDNFSRFTLPPYKFVQLNDDLILIWSLNRTMSMKINLYARRIYENRYGPQDFIYGPAFLAHRKLTQAAA